jgi:hypothetical protein
MPPVARNAAGGLVYHALSRANGQLRLFQKPTVSDAERWAGGVSEPMAGDGELAGRPG